MFMKIALVDDEITQLQLLRNLISTELHTLVPNTSHKIDGFRSGQSFFEHWTPGSYDVVILDIFMGSMLGVDVAKRIRETDTNVKLVFCSRSNEFAAESYMVNAQYYLLKPATQGSVSTMLRRLNLELIQLGQTVTLPDGHPITLRKLLYTEYYNHVVTLYFKGGDSYRIRANHAQIEELLCDSGYVYSPSKGILVNFHEIISLTDDGFVLSDGTTIPISRRRSKEIQSTYTKFRFQKMRTEVTAE